MTHNLTTNFPICYCLNTLNKYTVNWNNSICYNCFESYDNIRNIYNCGTYNKCKYKNICGNYYNVCLNCYNSMKTDNNIITNDIVSRTQSQINFISYIYILFIFYFNI